MAAIFSWESCRICANLTRPLAEGRRHGEGEREGGVEVGDWGMGFLIETAFHIHLDSHHVLTHGRLL